MQLVTRKTLTIPLHTNLQTWRNRPVQSFQAFHRLNAEGLSFNYRASDVKYFTHILFVQCWEPLSISPRKFPTSSTSLVLATSPGSTCPRCHRTVAAWTATPCSLPCTSHMHIAQLLRRLKVVLMCNNHEYAIMCSYWKSSAGATRNGGGGPYPHLWHIADRSHHSRGTPASAVLAVSWQDILWIQPRGLCLHSPARHIIIT